MSISGNIVLATWAVSVVAAAGAVLSIASPAKADSTIIRPYELAVEYRGNVYIADYGLTYGQCMAAASDLVAFELRPGVVVPVDSSVSVSCVQE